MNIFYRFLLDIKNRPAVFLGEPSLNRLLFFVYGYQICLARHELSEEIAFFSDFLSFVEMKFRSRTANHWDVLIERQCSSKEEAFYLFYDLLEEYIDAYELRGQVEESGLLDAYPEQEGMPKLGL